jgi:CxxC-x17-CxxC domain-containing protein
MADKNIICADCRDEFSFSESEQQFYADKGFTEPKRCASCRRSRKAARENGESSSYSQPRDAYSAPLPGSPRGYNSGSYEDRPQREFFDAPCSNCGKTARVPFRPTTGKPVYCSDCFRDQRASV